MSFFVNGPTANGGFYSVYRNMWMDFMNIFRVPSNATNHGRAHVGGSYSLLLMSILMMNIKRLTNGGQ